jgi:hypothetical protein
MWRLYHIDPAKQAGDQRTLLFKVSRDTTGNTMRQCDPSNKGIR